MMIVMFSIICAYYILSDLLLIYNAKQTKAFRTYLIIMAFAYCIWVMVAMDVKITSPAVLIKKAVTAVFR